MIPIEINALVTVPKGLVKGAGIVDYGMTKRAHLNYCIVEVAQNIWKNPGDVSKLTDKLQ